MPEIGDAIISRFDGMIHTVTEVHGHWFQTDLDKTFRYGFGDWCWAYPGIEIARLLQAASDLQSSL